ncbi:hypothetical protein THIOSC13_80010 [uncultured Thiomicrorhabdus sp.]
MPKNTIKIIYKKIHLATAAWAAPAFPIQINFLNTKKKPQEYSLGALKIFLRHD